MSTKTHQKSFLHGKTILVTGGTGSFGNRFIQIVLKEYKLTRLVVFSRDELKQEEMRTMKGFTDERLRFFIGDVRDKERLNRALHNIDIIIHTAALKQIAAGEYNPIEMVKTNIGGAENIINTAIDRGIKKVIALSTDKAVNPINLYGATKLVAEKLFIQGNNYSDLKYGTKFSCVRYGNVIGSRGSIVPLLHHQQQNGKITITDKRMTRFWISLDDGVRFVIRALELMKGGEVFVPKIPSMKIMDLAQAVAPNCKVKFIGIRPGEKIHEVLISTDEAKNTYEYKNMYIIKPVSLFRSPNNPILNKSSIMKLPSYSSDTNSDWLTVNQLRKLAKSI